LPGAAVLREPGLFPLSVSPMGLCPLPLLAVEPLRALAKDVLPFPQVLAWVLGLLAD
jgi:hypothetical protein